MSMRSVRRLAGLGLLVLLIAAVIAIAAYPRATGPASGTTLLPPPQSDPTTRPNVPLARLHHGLRVGTFNIDGGVGLDDVLDLGRTAKCLQQLDVIAVQEVHGFGGTPPTNQAQTLAGLLHLPFLYAPSERRWGHESFGNAVFSGLPVTHWTRVVLPNKPLHARRNYVVFDVTWRGIPVHFIATHVDWKIGGDQQFDVVANAFLHLPAPAVLLGDLNHPFRSSQIQQLLNTPGVDEAVHRFFGTEQAPRVDWIFTRGLTTTDAGIVDIKASDHPAFWAELTLRPAHDQPHLTPKTPAAAGPASAGR